MMDKPSEENYNQCIYNNSSYFGSNISHVTTTSEQSLASTGKEITAAEHIYLYNITETFSIR